MDSEDLIRQLEELLRMYQMSSAYNMQFDRQGNTSYLDLMFNNDTYKSPQSMAGKDGIYNPHDLFSTKYGPKGSYTNSQYKGPYSKGNYGLKGSGIKTGHYTAKGASYSGKGGYSGSAGASSVSGGSGGK